MGAMAGLALGDALGMPTQSMSAEQICQYYDGPITKLMNAVPQQPIAPNMKAGAVTDDTEQAFVLAQRLIDDNGCIDNTRYAHDLLQWEAAMKAKGSLDLLGPSTKAALQKLTEGASILGLFVMGVLVTKWTSINVPLVVSQTPAADGATVTITVQNILDQLCPGLLALGLTLLMVRLLNKKINPVWLIFALFGLGIIGNALGFLS